MTRRKIANSKNRSFWISLNKSLRKYHKEIEISLMVTGLVHGLFSSSDILSFNLETLLWLLSILLGLNWLFKVQLSRFKSWISIHRGLTVAFLMVLLLHIKEVGGVQVLSVIRESRKSTTVSQSSVMI